MYKERGKCANKNVFETNVQLYTYIHISTNGKQTHLLQVFIHKEHANNISHELEVEKLNWATEYW